MAITIIQKMVPSTTMGGFDIPIFAYNEATNSTYKDGALLAVSSGTLVEATAATPTTGIIGVALQPGQNITNPGYPKYGEAYPSGASTGQGSSTAGVASAVTPLLYVPAIPSVIFEATFASNGSDVAINTTDMWTKYGLTKDSTSGFWYVDKNKTTTNGSVIVVGVKNPQDLTFGTTTGARVFFVFNVTETVWI